MTMTSHKVFKMRAKLGLNQTDFGELLGVSQRTVRQWEGGGRIEESRVFALTALELLLQALGAEQVTPTWLKRARKLIGGGNA